MSHCRQPRVDSNGGWVAPGFEEVRAEFDRNFVERGEIGAAVAAYWRGEKVVDLWGGRRTPDGDEPWNEDTMVVVNSTTKGLAAMTIAVAELARLDRLRRAGRRVLARVRPERQGRDHRSPAPQPRGRAWSGSMSPCTSRICATSTTSPARSRKQKPAWEPGTRHGYHAMTIGLYMQELIRHVDPAHRTLGRFFHEEIAEPLGIEFYIGLPPEVPDERLAQLRTFTAMRALRALPRHRGRLRAPDPVAVVAAAEVDAVRRRSTPTIALGSRSRSRQATALGRRARSRGPIRRSPKAGRTSASRQRRWRASRHPTTSSVRTG